MEFPYKAKLNVLFLAIYYTKHICANKKPESTQTCNLYNLSQSVHNLSLVFTNLFDKQHIWKRFRFDRNSISVKVAVYK